jgi:hypothetical protein
VRIIGPLILLLVVLVVAFVIVWVRGAWREFRRRRYQVTTFVDGGGSMIVAVEKELPGGTARRVVKTLPPGMEPIDFKVELQEALAEATQVRDSLNER